MYNNIPYSRHLIRTLPNMNIPFMSCLGNLHCWDFHIRNENFSSWPCLIKRGPAIGWTFPLLICNKLEVVVFSNFKMNILNNIKQVLKLKLSRPFFLEKLSPSLKWVRQMSRYEIGRLANQRTTPTDFQYIWYEATFFGTFPKAGIFIKVFSKSCLLHFFFTNFVFLV